MAFPREAFVPDLPFPPEPEAKPVLVVSEDTARSMIKARIDMATKRARSKFSKAFSGESYHSLFSINYGKPPYIPADWRAGQEKVVLDPDSDLQQIGLEEMKIAGLDETDFDILYRDPRGNGTFEESREYPSQTIKGLKFGRLAYLTEDESPIFSGWAVKG